MELTITAGEQTQLSPHFKAYEFYSNSPDRPKSHPFFSQLVEAAEYLREYFNTPWRITSTFRTEAHERRILAAAGVKFFVSQHMKGRAFDSQPVNGDPEIMRALAADFVANGPIYQKLRQIGITGFGLYPTFIHLDCRVDEFKANRRDAFGLVACWDQRPNAKKKFGGAAWIPSEPPTNPTKATAPLAAFLPTKRPGPGSCSR